MKLFNKLTSYIRGEDLDESEEIIDSSEKNETVNIQEREKKSINNLTPFRTKRNYLSQRNSESKSQDIIIFSPCDVTEAASACNYLRENKICIIDLQGVDRANAQRIADFLSGGAYIVDGDIQRVSADIFLVAPASVSITGEFKEKLKENGLILPWISSSIK